jgi:hypothetical protein
MAPKQRATPRRTKDEVYELNATAMGEILGRFRGGKSTHPLTAYTVMRYVHNNAGDIPNFPQPDRLDGQRSTWRSTRIPEIEEWARNRPGRGAGGGRPWPDPPTLDEGYVPCALCKHPVERHDIKGCHPRDGKLCPCPTRTWTTKKIRGARLAAGLSERHTLQGSTI